MDPQKLRRRICFEAAQLLHSRRETTFVTAKWRAARSVTRSYVHSEALPTDMEIRMALQDLVSDQPPPQITVEQPTADDDLPSDRFARYHALLEPLDRVQLKRDTHPEGDLLYHSLQVFELAREARPWDEDFLLAALLHDVGKGIDPVDAENATLMAVEHIVSDRTFWFIASLPLQHRVHEGTIGLRARRRLLHHEDGEELRLLAQCDSDGRVPGRRVDSLEDCVSYVQNLNAGSTDDWC